MNCQVALSYSNYMEKTFFALATRKSRANWRGADEQ
jgi:hypothetical protein